MNTAPAMPVPPAPARPRGRALAPLEPVSPRAQWLLGLGFFVLFFTVWGAFTLGCYVSPTFLASPVTMAREGWLLFTEFNFIHDIGMTVWRVVGGFVLAAVVKFWSCDHPTFSISSVTLFRRYLGAHR